MCFWHHAILAFTCSKSTIETLEQGVKSVQSQQIKHQKEVNWVVLLTLLLILYLLFFNSVKFEQGNAGWAEPLKIGVFESSCLLSVVWIR